MLRDVPMKAFSKKISSLIGTLIPSETQMGQPILVNSDRRDYNWQSAAGGTQNVPRRRRYTRSQMGNGSGAFRTSWF